MRAGCDNERKGTKKGGERPPPTVYQRLYLSLCRSRSQRLSRSQGGMPQNHGRHHGPRQGGRRQPSLPQRSGPHALHGSSNGLAITAPPARGTLLCPQVYNMGCGCARWHGESGTWKNGGRMPAVEDPQGLRTGWPPALRWTTR